MGSAWTFESLTLQKREVLEKLMTSGTRVTVADVVGFEFKGWNLNALTSLIGTRKFKKGFYRDAATGTPWGYNVRVKPGAIEDPWLALPSEQEPKRFYFFGISEADDSASYPQALIVDYRRWPKNLKIDPVRYTVDYLVRGNSADPDLLIGKSYAELPFAKPFLGFFILERHNPTGLSGHSE